METLFWLLVAIAGPAIILLSIGFVAPLVRLERQVANPMETPQRPAEMPTAVPSPTVIYVWPTLTPGTPTPMPIRYSNDEIDTLAAAIAYEALNQPIEGMAAVAEVVVRWAEREGKVFSEVLTEEFFGSEDGVERIKAMKEWWKPDNNEIHMDIWATITLIAINVANGWLPEQCPEAMHFYNPKLVEEPAWAKGKEPLCIIGDHWFYGGGNDEPTHVIASVFTRQTGGTMYDIYEVKLQIDDRICGGVPKHGDMIKAWVEARTGYDDEKAQEIIKETSAEVATAEILDDKAAKNWTGFKSDGDGVYIEARQVKALLKESANILKGIKGSTPIIDIRNLKHKLAERVFVRPRRISLGKSEPDGFEEHAIHVFTARGPRDSIKRVDYVERPVITFQLEVLADGLIGEEELTKILEHGERLGLGANRSQGYGQFEVVSFQPK